jgi:exodeoxyribonuclease V beta subunit
VTRVSRPEILDRVRWDRSTIIEASAGTGKTYALEHLVVDLVLSGRARIEEILVVTFTEKATAELRRRVRTKLSELLRAPTDPEARPSSGSSWCIDAQARRRLYEALCAFDCAPISTIHGFCQRVLSEHAFESRRLFEETLVEERTAFEVAFRQSLRRALAVEPGLREYLEAWLEAGHSVEALGELLFEAHRARGALRPVFDPRELARAMNQIRALDRDAVARALETADVPGTTRKAVEKRLERLTEISEEVAGRGPAALLVALADDDSVRYLEKHLPLEDPRGPLVKARTAVEALARAAVPISAAVAGRFLPRVREELDRQKRARATYDFHDLLTSVAQALEGKRGQSLLRVLRARYRFALIDEFQDTDPVQWRIFERIFLEGRKDRPLVVIGDPKQAIYSFREADVRVYLRAREAIQEAIPLVASFRATPALLAAQNLIFDQNVEAPFFSGQIRHERPVECGRPSLVATDASGTPWPPLHLFEISTPPHQGKLRARLARDVLGARIAQETAELLRSPPHFGERGAEKPVQARDIFVLTRTTAEGIEVGEALCAAGVPHAYYKQEGLFQSAEAFAVRDLLAAVADPDDRALRHRAWTSPFFALRLADLLCAEELPAEHPLWQRLLEWRALALGGDCRRLFSRILEESGIVRRERFLGGSERALTNYLHLFEVLLAEASRTRETLAELVQRLDGYLAGQGLPQGNEPDLQRLETERDAVQIMTIHKAKGLEATVVFLFGGFLRRPAGKNEVRIGHEGKDRIALVGRPHDPALVALVETEAAEEDERLCYVALTRARARLYLPYFPEEAGKLDGSYRVVNARLARIAPILERAGLLTREVVKRDLRPARVTDAVRRSLATWPVPEEAEMGPGDFEALRARHAGFVVTSYTRLKQAEGDYHAAPVEPDDLAREPTPPAAFPPPEKLPAGSATGVLLHEILESVDLAPLAARPPFEQWRDRPEVRDLFHAALLRHGLALSWIDEALRLVHGALVMPIRLGQSRIALAQATRVLREMEFLYPIAEPGHPRLSDPTPGPFVIERGYVKGFVDLIFEVDGLVYLADWKSDVLPDWSAAAVSRHVEEHYRLQARLYALALVKMLGVHDAAGYERRMGGLLYCFLRGMRPDGEGTEGIHFERPSWRQILGWEEDLAQREIPGAWRRPR